MSFSEMENPNGDERCVTTVFDQEDYMVGNALRWVVSTYPNVVFCGYTMPHRAKDKVKFRIQTSRGSAEDVLRQGLKDLMKVLLLVKNKGTIR